MIDDYVRFVREIVRVIDGDTFEFLLDLGYRTYTRAHIRVFGLYAAELDDAEGVRAKTVAEAILRGAQRVSVQSHMTRTLEPTQSFSRWIGDVYCDGISIITLLHEAEPVIAMKMTATAKRRLGEEAATR